MGKSSTPSYVLTLELNISEREAFIIEKKLRIARQIYNDCLGESMKRLHQMQSNKEYNSLRKELAEISKSLKDRRKEDPRYIKVCERLDEIANEFGFTEAAIQHYAITPRANFYNAIGSVEVQELAARAFKAANKVCYGDAKKVRFKSADDDMSVQNKSNESGLRHKDGKIIWGKLTLSYIVKRKDKYAQMALMDRTKFVRILKRAIRGKTRYYVQLIQEGTPPGSQTRKNPPKGNVGTDVGVSTIAIVSDKTASLRELAPRIEADYKEIRRLQRKMDRSRRATNPDNYNEDGTIKKGKKTWVESNHYKRDKAKLKELWRRVADKKLQSHNTLANEIISLGDRILVETMRFKSLQKRAKKATVNKKNGKFNSKKRFGKSIANHAPALLISIIDRKLHYTGNKIYKIDTASVKASQYNHVTNTYQKKDLSERWNIINDIPVQRDLYSAFLIKNVKSDLKSVSRRKCAKGYDNFLELHNKEIKRIEKSPSKAIRNIIKKPSPKATPIATS